MWDLVVSVPVHCLSFFFNSAFEIILNRVVLTSTSVWLAYVSTKLNCLL